MKRIIALILSLTMVFSICACGKTSASGESSGTDPVMAEFEFNEDQTEVIRCPKGNVPVGNTYCDQSGMIRVSFKKSDCQHCPFKDQCKVKFQKKNAVVTLSAKMKARAEYLKLLGTDEYRQLARKRNAIEGIPSVLRRRYHIDQIPVFGKQRSKIFFYFKVGAFNIVKLMRHLPIITSNEMAMA